MGRYWNARRLFKSKINQKKLMIKRLLIVGYGSIGKRHARLARDLFPNAKIIILRHRVSKKTKYVLLVFQAIEHMKNLSRIPSKICFD